MKSRLRANRKPKISVIPIVTEVVVEVPAKYGQHASSAGKPTTKNGKPSPITRAHTFIKKIFGQITKRNLPESGTMPNYGAKFRPIGKGDYHAERMKFYYSRKTVNERPRLASNKPKWRNPFRKRKGSTVDTLSNQPFTL